MKIFLLYICIFAVAVFGWLPFEGTELGKLKPVELVLLSQEEGTVILSTDTGDSGRGTTVSGALENLKATAAGILFLDTADFLIVTPDCAELIDELGDYLRPSCSVCLGPADLKPEETAAFLQKHQPKTTLRDRKTGEKALETLKITEGRMELEK